jgi:adenylate cyclase
MIEEQAKRKLTAILSADVKGYSRLMADDEEATVATINAYREVMTGLIKDHRGRVVDAKGDNVLAEFSSVVDAVRCAVKVQKELTDRNSRLPQHRRMQFRIGINLGDVIEEQETIYGDGVNVAARLEALAEGGGICISGTAFDHVKKKISVGYEYQGEQRVKNIPDTVRVYKVLVDPKYAGTLRGERTTRSRLLRLGLPSIGIVLLASVCMISIYNAYFHLPDVAVASSTDVPIPISKGPSLAVLPFVNMSEEPKQEYFSDGLTENLIMGLSSCPKLVVIARNSTFFYKGRSVKVQQIANELGVQYVLEGSVQKSNDRVRITVQLIVANTGNHIWAAKYDRDLKDVFALQDEITMEVMSALEIELTEGEQARSRYKGPSNLENFMKMQEALKFQRRHNKKDNIRARDILEEAISLNPRNAYPYILTAFTYLTDLWLGADNSVITFALATRNIKMAMELDKGNADLYLVLSYLYMMRKDLEGALASAEQAISLNPNGADAYCQLATVLYYAGNLSKSTDVFNMAIRLNPIPPAYYFNNLGNAFLAMSKYDKAEESHKKALALEPDFILSHIGLTGTYVLMGNKEKARDQAKEVLGIDPNYSVDYLVKTSPNRDQVFVKRFVAALREGGLK